MFVAGYRRSGPQRYVSGEGQVGLGLRGSLYGQAALSGAADSGQLTYEQLINRGFGLRVRG